MKLNFIYNNMYFCKNSNCFYKKVLRNFWKIINITFIILFTVSYIYNFSYATQNSFNTITLYDENSPELQIYADSCFLLEQTSMTELYNKNGFEKMYPASTTKLVTAILVLENCNLDDMVNVSYYAVHSVPATYSIVNLIPNESFSVKDLLYTLLIGSANDSAFVLAEYVANHGNNYPLDSSKDSKNKFTQSIETFSNMMNEKAKELGCLNTHFVNPNGIHNENHYSTAYDLALIGSFFYNNTTLMSIVHQMSYSLPNTDLYDKEIRTCHCTNLLLYNDRSSYYLYADGMKTGYTDAAGYCIVASAKKDDITLIAVILNSKNSNYSKASASTGSNDNSDDYDDSREGDCKKLFDYGFDNYSYLDLASSGSIATTLNIINSNPNSNSVNLLVKDNIKTLVRKDEVYDITPKIKINKLFAPIAKGEIIGTIYYHFNGQDFQSDLIASNDVYSSNYLYFVLGLFIIFIILLIIVIIVFRKKK